MPQHDRPNAERLRMMMETNEVSVDQVADMLAVPQETVERWLRNGSGAQAGGEDISEDALTRLRMKLAVTR